MIVCKNNKEHKEFYQIRTQIYQAAVDEEGDNTGPFTIDVIEERYRCSVCGGFAYDDEVEDDG
jgi:hypothetical protein